MKNFFLLFILFFTGFILVNCQTTKLMTYNIRYDNPGDKENRWGLRKDFLTDQLKFYEPDIFGIQEGMDHQVSFIDSCLPDYSFVGIGRKDGKTKGEYSALFFKTTKYEIINSSTFWLSITPEEVSVGWDAALERICTYVLLEENISKQKFWVFNTHFDHRGDLARKNSARLIIKKIKELNTENYPVFLMGDLNLQPENEAIQFITKYLNDSKRIASTISFGPEGTFNGFNYNFTESNRIDYIFTGKTGLKVIKYAVLTDSKDQRFPSDHFPVYVEVFFYN